MSSAARRRGSALVGALNALETWQAELILNFRLWCDGPAGQARVWNRMATGLPRGSARPELMTFERLIGTIGDHSHRQLIRRDVACACICSDEAVFLHLIETASAGDLSEATKIASLMVPAAHAEEVALMAAQVGETAKRLSEAQAPKTDTPDNVVWLH